MHMILPMRLPDHTQLPDSDGKPLEFFAPPQRTLLTGALLPVLHALHPDGQYLIGQNNGIYWRFTDPPLNGCKVPDWFYVPDVPPLLDGALRRSYVLWQEAVAPLVIIEFASRDGGEERDQTPHQGKFWVYERVLRTPYYAIFVFETGQLEAYQLLDGLYRPMTPNERGHFPIKPLGVELGLWFGAYDIAEATWTRWFDAQGNLLLTGSERAEQERQRADRLAERLRALGIDPDQP